MSEDLKTGTCPVQDVWSLQFPAPSPAALPGKRGTRVSHMTLYHLISTLQTRKCRHVQRDVTRIKLIDLLAGTQLPLSLLEGAALLLAVSEGGLEFRYVTQKGYCPEVQYQNI